MKSNFFIHTILLYFVFNTGILFAQKLGITEENNIEFQTNFFDALKQKVIANYTKAIESLEKCYQIDSTNVAVDFELSKNYFMLKKYAEAEIFINKALYKKPLNSYLLQQKVAIYKAMQNFEKAIKIQEQIVELKPNLSNDLVLLYIQNKEFKKAEKLINNINKNALSNYKTKGLQQYLISRNKIISNKKPTVSIEANKNTIIDLISDFNKNKEYKLLVKIINFYVKNKQFTNLVTITKQGLDYFPTQPVLYYNNGLALNKTKKYSEAVAVLTIGIDFVIDNPSLQIKFYNELAKSYAGLNQPKNAQKFKQKAVLLKEK